MNVLIIHGSPNKKGSSSAVANAFGTQAEEMGAEVAHYHLNKLNFKGCQGCMACKMGQEQCVVKDDLTEVLEAHHKADVVVWASPVYFYDTTGQFKTFLDRTFSFVGPDFESNPESSRLPRGKKGVFILSQGAKFFQHYDTAARYEMFMKFYGISEPKVIRATEMSMPSKTKLQPYTDQAIAYAKELLG